MPKSKTQVHEEGGHQSYPRKGCNLCEAAAGTTRLARITRRAIDGTVSVETVDLIAAYRRKIADFNAGLPEDSEGFCVVGDDECAEYELADLRADEDVLRVVVL